MTARMERLRDELRDQLAHAMAAFLVLAIAKGVGADWSDASAVLIAWALGFVREFTEWQDGGNHPFTRWGILDQLGWILGGVLFTLVARP